MKQDFVDWLQTGIIDKIITIKSAQEIYKSLYDDFPGGDFNEFIFSVDCGSK